MVSFRFLLLLLLLLFVGMAAAAGITTLTNVPGFFAQDSPETDAAQFDYIKSNFGLLDEFTAAVPGEDESLCDGCPPWGRFKSAIATLNRDAPEGTTFRVFFLARHGQGFHNVAEAFYGTALWDAYWSKLDGNGTIVWADAKLTEQGIQEARNASAAWKAQIAMGIPLPQSFYSSPLQRSVNTLEITWSGIALGRKGAPGPVIKEKLRETLGVHTCDRRSSKTYLAETFPEFGFEKGFTEYDALWDPDVRESNAERDVRLGEALRDIVENDDSTYITISAHSGAITSILSVIGHRDFRLKTGAIIPVVVKVERSGSR